MPKSISERQSDWRQRLLLRSAYFDLAEVRRRAGLWSPLLGDESPEAKTLARFFAAYPHCWRLPESVARVADAHPAGESWHVYFGEGKDEPDHEVAAAFVALSEITSLRVSIEGHEGTKWFTSPLIDEVKREVALLRELGMWRSA